MINVNIKSPDSIQNYLTQASIDGGGIIQLQPGTYVLSSDIYIPDGVTLEGSSRDNCIIDCNGDFGIYMQGTDPYSTGTVTINNGATGLVGSGTTWTSAMVGQYVLLDGSWYEITAFTDTTHITIDTYQGANLSGGVYMIATPNFNATLSRVTVTGATAIGITIGYSMESNVLDVVVSDCGTGIDIDYAVFPKLVTTCNSNGVNLNMNYVDGFFIDFSEFSFSTTGAGVVMTNVDNSTFFNSSVNDNTGDGLNLTSCTKIAFISFDVSGNGGQGFEYVSGCNDNQISMGLINGNTSDGIKLTATSDRNSISQLSVTSNGGWGVNIANANCDSNVLVGVIAASNSSGSITDSGTGTLKSTTVNVLP